MDSAPTRGSATALRPLQATKSFKLGHIYLRFPERHTGKPAELEVLGSPKAAPVMHFSEPDPRQGYHNLSQVYRVGKGELGRVLHQAERPGFRNTAHKDTLAQWMLPRSQRYTVYGWLHRGTPPQEDYRETHVTRVSQLRGIWDEKQEDKLHCSGLWVTRT